MIYDGHPVPPLKVLIWAPEESVHLLDLLQPWVLVRQNSGLTKKCSNNEIFNTIWIFSFKKWQKVQKSAKNHEKCKKKNSRQRDISTYYNDA